jgi:Tfp pilus assembly protein PilF
MRSSVRKVGCAGVAEGDAMKAHVRYWVNLAGAVLLSACAAGGPPRAVYNDRLPMYGGSGPRDDPAAQAQDEKLIADLIQRYGSRQAAAQKMLELGGRYFQAGNYAMAMRNFNQAWLLTPNSPDPFWGFAIVYDDQGKSCDAKAMIDRALSLNLSKPAELADAGRIYTYCAISDASLGAADRQQYFERAEELYFRAVSMASDNPYIYGSWAIAHYWQGDYADAWKMIKKQQALGGQPGEDFLQLLRTRMPEPRH